MLAQSTAGIINSQSTKTTKSGMMRGDDGEKKVKGRKRGILTNTTENMLDVIAHSADIQDEDFASNTIISVMQVYPSLQKIYTDCGYEGR